jgi:hypothetical protein
VRLLLLLSSLPYAALAIGCFACCPFLPLPYLSPTLRERFRPALYNRRSRYPHSRLLQLSISSSWWVNCCKTLTASFAHIGTLHQAAPSTSLFCLRISVVPDHHTVCSCHFPSLYLKHPDAHMLFQLWALSRRQFGIVASPVRSLPHGVIAILARRWHSQS